MNSDSLRVKPHKLFYEEEPFTVPRKKRALGMLAAFPQNRWCQQGPVILHISQLLVGTVGHENVDTLGSS